MERTIVTIRNIDKQLWREFRAESTRQGKNVAELLQEAMRLFLAEPKEPK
jgi:hypothetical protein